MNSKIFAEFCRKERQRRNMTLAEQSDSMGMSPLRISKLETGADELSLDHIKKVCSFFRTPADELKKLIEDCSQPSNVIFLKSRQKMKLYQLSVEQIKSLRSKI